MQSPEDAEYPGMPLAAIATGFVDHIVTKDTLVTAICNAVEQCGRHSDLAAWEAPFKSFETSSPVSPVRVLDTSPN